MRDHVAEPLTVRLHALVSRLSREGGFTVAQADVAEAVARIVQLERALLELLGHVENDDAQEAVANARAMLANSGSPK